MKVNIKQVKNHRNARKPVHCFQCHKFGHIARNYPLNSQKLDKGSSPTKHCKTSMDSQMLWCGKPMTRRQELKAQEVMIFHIWESCKQPFVVERWIWPVYLLFYWWFQILSTTVEYLCFSGQTF